MITDAQRDLLAEVFSEVDSHHNDKITVTLEPVSRTMTVEFHDLDDEWFREMAELAAKGVAG